MFQPLAEMEEQPGLCEETEIKYTKSDRKEMIAMAGGWAKWGSGRQHSNR